MLMQTIYSNSDQIAMISSAMAVIFSMLAVAWPYMAKTDDVSARLARMEGERKALRDKERERMNKTEKTSSLITKPRPIYQTIVDRLNLAKMVDAPETRQKLQAAGFRGRGPGVTFVAAKYLIPVLMLPMALIYGNIVFGSQYSFLAIAAGAVVLAAISHYAPEIYVKNRATRRQQEISNVWPDALDLLLLSVEAGMSVEAAFRKVSEEIGSSSPELADELTLTTAELSYLQSRRQAFENLGNRVGTDGVRSVMTSLIQAEKYGTPLGRALRVLSQESRDMRMAAAEKRAASLPPKLTVPMIVFFLPVLFAVIMTPAVVQILEEFRGG